MKLILKKKRGCPYCSGNKIKIGFNDMWTTAPEIARFLKNPEDGYKYTKNSNKKLDWTCPDCGEDLLNYAPCEMARYNGRFPCKRCGVGTSYPNRFMFNLLSYINVEFEPEKSFSWSDGKIYDFYLPLINTIIEMHGVQHYKYTGFKQSLEEIQENDKYKEKLAKENGVANYIVIDCIKSEPNYIYNNILLSKLVDIIKLENIDLNYIHEQSIKKYLNVVIDSLKENDGDIVDTAKQLKKTIQCIYKYMHIAEEIGLYKHDREKAKRKRDADIVKTSRNKYGKPFMCVETGHVFDSGSSLEKNSIDIFGQKICRSCTCVAANKGIVSYGYHWKYISHEQFNQIKTNSPEKAFGEFFIA